MLTRSGWAVLVGAGLGAATGRLVGAAELYVLAATAAALVVLALAWVRRPVPALAADRRIHPGRLSAGAPGRVDLTITNRGTRRLPPVLLQDPVEGTVGANLALGPLPGGTSQEVGYRLPLLRRGLLHIGPLTVELVDAFGLARRRLPGTRAAVLTVLPAIDPAPTLPMGNGRHEPLAGLSRKVAATAGVEDLVTLRPYVVGDDLRRVHWPSTAHADDLLVRRDEERWQGHVAILVDTRAAVLDDSGFERAVSAAAGIVDAVAAAGDRVRLATTAGSDSGMVDAQRAEHDLLDELAIVTQQGDVDTRLPQADPRRPVALVVLTGADPGGLPDAVRDAGFAQAVIVRFAGTDTAARSPGAAGWVTVAPDEPFAAAWSRQVPLEQAATVWP